MTQPFLKFSRQKKISKRKGWVSAIVVAAGKGLRLNSKIHKLLIKVNGCPILVYSLRVLNRHPLISEIILVVNRENSLGIANAIRKLSFKKLNRIVLGGRRRQDSVYSGLRAINERSGFVLIHDAARPFIDSQLVSRTIRAAFKTGAAIAAIPVKGTVKIVSRISYLVSRVEKTLDRSKLWEAQTPQVFKRALILEAYRRFGKLDVTDDAALVEKLGSKVYIVPGDYANLKITTPEDLVVAEAIVKSKLA